MIRRKIKQKTITITEAINLYGPFSKAVLATVIAEAEKLARLHYRYYYTLRYQQYLNVSDEHLEQIALELDRRSKSLCGEEFELALSLTPGVSGNAALVYFISSDKTIQELKEKYGDFEYCIPTGTTDNFSLFFNLIRYNGTYSWFKTNHRKIPNGKIVLNDLIMEMEQVFTGKLEGRQPWHVLKSKTT
ncbi:MAG: hypothetical protein JNM57_14685 [Cyclobacteriaceae bacterium]|nr:hypothetical protein [Cyclobacteriaceae bacterium]